MDTAVKGTVGSDTAQVAAELEANRKELAVERIEKEVLKKAAYFAMGAKLN